MEFDWGKHFPLEHHPSPRRREGFCRLLQIFADFCRFLHWRAIFAACYWQPPNTGRAGGTAQHGMVAAAHLTRRWSGRSRGFFGRSRFLQSGAAKRNGDSARRGVAAAPQPPPAPGQGEMRALLPAPQTTAPSPREAATARARSCWLHARAGILCRGARQCREGFAGCRLPSFTGTRCIIAAAFRRVKLGRILLLKAFWRAGCSPVLNLGEIFS